jgi:hypothetical protein
LTDWRSEKENKVTNKNKKKRDVESLTLRCRVLRL